MRIIAGKFKGRRLYLPDHLELRPSSDRVREAVFSTLFSLRPVLGPRVLDLFAGSGALGIEALSRGAAEVVFVEQSPKVSEALKKSISHLGLEGNALCLTQDWYLAIKTLAKRSEGLVESGTKLSGAPRIGGKYDLIFADPPYANHPGEQIIKALLEYQIAQKETILVIESGKGLLLPERFTIDGASLSACLVKDKSYGDTVVRFLNSSDFLSS